MSRAGNAQRWISSVSTEDFERGVLLASQQQPVLVDFWAEWCSLCLVIAPVLKQVIERYAGTVLLAKVEVDLGDNMKLAGQYQVRGFPSIFLFSAGEVVGCFSGARSARYIHDFLAEHAIIAPSI